MSRDRPPESIRWPYLGSASFASFARHDMQLNRRRGSELSDTSAAGETMQRVLCLYAPVVLVVALCDNMDALAMMISLPFWS